MNDDVTFLRAFRGGGLDLVQWNCQAPTNQTIGEATTMGDDTPTALGALRVDEEKLREGM